MAKKSRQTLFSNREIHGEFKATYHGHAVFKNVALLTTPFSTHFF